MDTTYKFDKFDHVFYGKRYRLDIDDADALKRHYYKVGKGKGYYPNALAEKFYVQTMNFDADYYKRRYNVQGSDKEVFATWKRSGFKKVIM